MPYYHIYNGQRKKKELIKLLSEMDNNDVKEVLKKEVDEEIKSAITGINKKRKAPPRAWKPGQSGNPLGRPKGQFSFAKQFRNIFDKKASDVETINERALELGVDPDTITIGELFAISIISDTMTGRDAIAREVINRIDGKIPDIIVQEIVTNNMNKLNNDELLELAKKAMEKLKNDRDE